MNLLFIITHKYNRNYKTYIKYYVNNIQKFYPNSFILIVDNNSEHIQDIIDIFKDYKNLKIIINNSICKFEIGAYKVGIKYIRKNKFLRKNFDYYVFSQDNFILKNKFDVKKELYNKNIKACSINHGILKSKSMMKYIIWGILENDDTSKKILKRLNIYDRIKEFNITWCHSFILHKDKLKEFYDIVRDIVITSRQKGSIQSERYLSGILYYLNNYKSVSLCGNFINNDYDFLKIDIEKDSSKSYFVKRSQDKNENTK